MAHEIVGMDWRRLKSHERTLSLEVLLWKSQIPRNLQLGCKAVWLWEPWYPGQCTGNILLLPRQIKLNLRHPAWDLWAIIWHMGGTGPERPRGRSSLSVVTQLHSGQICWNPALPFPFFFFSFFFFWGKNKWFFFSFSQNHF